MVTLDKDEARNIAEMIEWHIFDQIRADPDIDNIEWLCNMVHLYERCRREETSNDC